MPSPDNRRLEEATPGAQAPVTHTLDLPPDRQLRIRCSPDRRAIVLRMFIRAKDAPAADGFAAEGRGLVIGAGDVGELRALLALAALELER